MDSNWVLVAYWICFLVGTVYALVSALLGGFFGAVGEIADIGGLDGIDGADVDYDGGIAPLSPATIAIFLATFGGTGIILTTLLDYNVAITLPVSAGAGFGLAAAVFGIFYKIFTSVQGSSEPRLADFVGLSAEVSIPIPANGIGEVVYVCRGNRLSSSARSDTGTELPRYQAVRIVKMVGNTAYVTPLTGDEPVSKEPTGSTDFNE